MALDTKTSQSINRLVSHVKNEHVFEKVTEEWQRDNELEKSKSKYNGRWGTPARRIFSPVLSEVFRQSFPNEDEKNALYVEGEGTSKLLGKPPKLFGSSIYPDLAVLRQRRIAIELDHSERGSGLKMALAKAAFNVLSDFWENCFVLFYNPNGKLSLDGKKEKG